MKEAVILLILAHFTDKNEDWANEQLDRALRNIDDPPNPEIYDNILKGEFGIEEKLKKDHTLSVLCYASGNVVLFSVPDLDTEEVEDYLEWKGYDSGNCSFMTFEGTNVIDARESESK